MSKNPAREMSGCTPIEVLAKTDGVVEGPDIDAAACATPMSASIAGRVARRHVGVAPGELGPGRIPTVETGFFDKNLETP